MSGSGARPATQRGASQRARPEPREYHGDRTARLTPGTPNNPLPGKEEDGARNRVPPDGYGGQQSNEALTPAVIFETFAMRTRSRDAMLTGPLPPQAVTPMARPVLSPDATRKADVRRRDSQLN